MCSFQDSKHVGRASGVFGFRGSSHLGFDASAWASGQLRTRGRTDMSVLTTGSPMLRDTQPLRGAGGASESHGDSRLQACQRVSGVFWLGGYCRFHLDVLARGLTCNLMHAAGNSKGSDACLHRGNYVPRTPRQNK